MSRYGRFHPHFLIGQRDHIHPRPQFSFIEGFKSIGVHPHFRSRTVQRTWTTSGGPCLAIRVHFQKKTKKRGQVHFLHSGFPAQESAPAPPDTAVATNRRFHSRSSLATAVSSHPPVSCSVRTSHGRRLGARDTPGPVRRFAPARRRVLRRKQTAA